MDCMSLWAVQGNSKPHRYWETARWVHLPAYKACEKWAEWTQNISRVTLQKQSLSHANLPNSYKNLSVNLAFFPVFVATWIHIHTYVCVWMILLGQPYVWEFVTGLQPVWFLLACQTRYQMPFVLRNQKDDKKLFLLPCLPLQSCTTTFLFDLSPMLQFSVFSLRPFFFETCSLQVNTHRLFIATSERSLYHQYGSLATELFIMYQNWSSTSEPSCVLLQGIAFLCRVTFSGYLVLVLHLRVIANNLLLTASLSGLRVTTESHRCSVPHKCWWSSVISNSPLGLIQDP